MNAHTWTWRKAVLAKATLTIQLSYSATLRSPQYAGIVCMEAVLLCQPARKGSRPRGHSIQVSGYQESAMPRIVLKRLAATLALTGLAMAPLSSCATADAARTASSRQDSMKSGAGQMLDEIYASRQPVRFEQVDVSRIVAKYVPVGTAKLVVLERFGNSPTSKIVEDTIGKVVVRDDKGQAMLDPDARSIVMTFSLDTDGKVTHVDAVHIKNQ
ncbi:hypothetical protein FHY18_003745 [Xanthomonas arboricola]|uniref:DUF6393 family protein n=1 Tax=Xanthomonas sp. 3793 TaxID=3035312 RepID=UPI002168063A|nr:DUF6393 family protein [Xanthomonas sp. 3793]MCS3748112.1 hypothetical protein [Xanthomonas sp. 3793]